MSGTRVAPSPTWWPLKVIGPTRSPSRSGLVRSLVSPSWLETTQVSQTDCSPAPISSILQRPGPVQNQVGLRENQSRENKLTMEPGPDWFPLHWRLAPVSSPRPPHPHPPPAGGRMVLPQEFHPMRVFVTQFLLSEPSGARLHPGWARIARSVPAQRDPPEACNHYLPQCLASCGKSDGSGGGGGARSRAESSKRQSRQFLDQF